ncbi:phosphatase PAP2 family protein [Halobacillus sp. Marseille-Q1614]|uniref:phosphatase PAP2 family protein n=1 Tax=Halobacillus sp. Marseille-Q1614 TaxID=2709134 RepID=UPI00156F293A|nr:phosphatase PAP2 family protein [Halobacillus sp. Marseille-Q1614]
MRRSLGIMAGSTLLFILLAWAIQASTPYIVKWDDRTVEWFSTAQEGEALQSALFLTHFGDYWICARIGAVLLLILLFLKKYRMLIWILVGLWGMREVNHALKAFFDRERPPVDAFTNASLASFPSGHVMYATFTYGVVLLVVLYLTHSTFLKGLAAVLTVSIIGAVLWTRVYLGVHYPTDVAAGLFAGLVWLQLIWLMATFKRTSREQGCQ